MPAATILVPTHNRPESLRFSVGSALAQTLTDFELFIVGDGMTEAARASALALAESDPRVRLFDFPKGERKGEKHRDAALREARGTFVAYLGDDDLWLPEHLATLDALLADADFGHTLHVSADLGGSFRVLACDLSDPQFRALMLTKRFGRFDFTFGAHRLEAYRRLKVGWAPPPRGFRGSDGYLWHQFLAQPWCRAKTAMAPTALNTQSHARPAMTDQERASELSRLTDAMRAPGFRETLWREAATAFAHDAALHFAQTTYKRQKHRIRDALRNAIGV